MTTWNRPAAIAALCLTACGADERDAADDGSAPAAAHTIEIAVSVPAGTPTVYLTGNLPELGPWDPALLAMSGDGRERRASVEAPAGYALEYKFTLGSWQREALGPSGTVPPNFTLTVRGDQAISHEIVGFREDPATYIADWRGSGVLGTLLYWQDVESAFLAERRHVEVWLPPGYEEDAGRRYRVIYMHDGQNLFDPRIANTGIDWSVDEAMMRGADQGLYEPAIVVGVWSSSRRLAEYSPWDGAPQYARFLIEELMPRVAAEFRVLSGPDDTFVTGSSMGGLLSWYLVMHHPDVFGACGCCVSSHFPLSEAVLHSITGADPGELDETPHILRDIANGMSVPEGTRYLFDYGTQGLDADYGPTHAAVRDWLLGEGLVEGRDFLLREYAGAEHNEASWRARLGDQLAWLLAGSVPAAEH